MKILYSLGKMYEVDTISEPHMNIIPRVNEIIFDEHKQAYKVEGVSYHIEEDIGITECFVYCKPVFNKGD